MNAHNMAAEFDRTFASELPLRKLVAVRVTLVGEEGAELLEALDGDNLAAVAQELADLKYVCCGLEGTVERLADSLGIDLDAALAEVHRANMSKLGPDGKPILRSDGKALKGPNYSPPNLTDAVTGARLPVTCHE